MLDAGVTCEFSGIVHAQSKGVFAQMLKPLSSLRDVQNGAPHSSIAFAAMGYFAVVKS